MSIYKDWPPGDEELPYGKVEPIDREVNGIDNGKFLEHQTRTGCKYSDGKGCLECPFKFCAEHPSNRAREGQFRKAWKRNRAEDFRVDWDKVPINSPLFIMRGNK